MQNHLSSLLRELLSDPRFGAVKEVANDLQKEWALPQSSRKRISQFDTIWQLAETEGKINGIRELLQELERIAMEE